MTINVQNDVTPTGTVATAVNEAKAAVADANTDKLVESTSMNVTATKGGNVTWNANTSITIEIPGVAVKPAKVLLNEDVLQETIADDNGCWTYADATDTLTVTAKHLSTITAIMAVPSSYTIAYAAGTGGSGSQSALTPAKPASGNTTIELGAPTGITNSDTLKKFGGWTVNNIPGVTLSAWNEKTGKQTLTIANSVSTTESITLTATWKPVGVSIDYYKNADGTVAAGRVEISGASNRADIVANKWYLVQITSQPQASVSRGIATLQLVKADAQGKLTFYTNKSGYLFVSQIADGVSISESNPNAALASLTLANLKGPDGGNMVVLNFHNLATVTTK